MINENYVLSNGVKIPKIAAGCAGCENMDEHIKDAAKTKSSGLFKVKLNQSAKTLVALRERERERERE